MVHDCFFLLVTSIGVGFFRFQWACVKSDAFLCIFRFSLDLSTGVISLDSACQKEENYVELCR